jgi:hypothetical protein
VIQTSISISPHPADRTFCSSVISALNLVANITELSVNSLVVYPRETQEAFECCTLPQLRVLTFLGELVDSVFALISPHRTVNAVTLETIPPCSDAPSAHFPCWKYMTDLWHWYHILCRISCGGGDSGYSIRSSRNWYYVQGQLIT